MNTPTIAGALLLVVLGVPHRLPYSLLSCHSGLDHDGSKHDQSRNHEESNAHHGNAKGRVKSIEASMFHGLVMLPATSWLNRSGSKVASKLSQEEFTVGH